MLREWRHGISVDYDAGGRARVAICFDAANFLRYGDELLREAPVVRLDLGRIGEHAAELVKHAGFQQMTALVLHEVGDPGAAVLGAAKLPALRELVVAECGLTATGVGALEPLVCQLEHLDVSNNAIGSAGTAKLAGAAFQRLSTLVLHGCQLDDAGVIALAASKSLHVRRLDLGGARTTRSPWRSQITETGCAALAKSTWVATVEQLQLAGTLLGDEGATALAAIGRPGPIDLDLRDDAIESDAAIGGLAAAPWTRLARIGLAGNLFPGQGSQDSYDYDGSVVARVPVLLDPPEIAAKFGFGARGVVVY